MNHKPSPSLSVTPQASSGLFRDESGNRYLFTFLLISSLFFLWAMCNGMIDVMDKHFQDYLHLSKRESAWVQFSHYLGYFLMALPAGWLARRLGYKVAS
jgi:FHS family L-fucose permease-like MFS transporter